MIKPLLLLACLTLSACTAAFSADKPSAKAVKVLLFGHQLACDNMKFIDASVFLWGCDVSQNNPFRNMRCLASVCWEITP